MVRAGKEKEGGDERFARLASDPRFLKQAKRKNKVVVDERFKGLFDEDQAEGPRVDKYGRKRGKDQSRDELKRFYRLDNDKEEGTSKPGQAGFVDLARGQVLMESSSEEESSEEEDESADEEEVAVGDRLRRASSELSIDLDEDDLPAQADEEPTLAREDETRRLAVVNLDWDHVRAIDLFKVFSSVLSPDAPDASRLPPLKLDTELKSKGKGTRIAKGRVVCVHVYPSEFGKERMEKENREGPPPAIFKAFEEKDEASGDELEVDERAVVKEDDGVEYDERALRKYQLERLRYFYAVVEFDTKSAARHVLDEVDGTEFERTANIFELRMVPDGMTFDDEPRDSAKSDSINYKGVDYVTDALRHSKVKLTWDADDPQRSKLTRRDMSKMNEDELNNLDVSQYLASDSSDGEASDPETNKRDALRKALGLVDTVENGSKATSKRKPPGEMEITFAPAFAETNEADPANETSLNAYQRKEKERRARKKAERAARQAETQDEEDEVEEDESAGSEGDVAEQDDDAGFDDPFFASDSDAEEAAFAGEDAASKTNGKQKPSKAERKAAKEAEQTLSAKHQAELSLLVDSDSDEGVEGKHFDMRAILKAEKEASKPKGKKKRRRPGKKGAEAEEPVADSFQVDVKDNRFSALHDDHRFAVDPTNPHYLKTRNTDKLLEESRRRRDAGSSVSTTKKAPVEAAPADTGLASLVAGVKRKAESRNAGKGKRTKR